LCLKNTFFILFIYLNILFSGTRLPEAVVDFAAFSSASASNESSTAASGPKNSPGKQTQY
jgi:hypothetical protein